jgi:hypothetical protein
MKKLTREELKKEIEEIEKNPFYQQSLKNGIPRCYLCGKKLKKFKPYLWKSDCPHIPKHLILAVG